MRAESKFLLGLGSFFGLMGIVYWFWSKENAGSVMILFGMALCFLPGSYYYFWSRRMKPRAEDDPNATQAQGAGVIGAFPMAERRRLFTELQPLVTGFDDHPWNWAAHEAGERTPRKNEFSRWNAGKDLSFVPL